MSDDTRMMLLHRSTNELVEELLMWKSLAAEYSARIAELEGFIDQLIEAGDAVINAYPDWIREEDDWDALVKDWKEG